MWKKLILFICILLSVSLVDATLNTGQLKAYYSFEGNANDNATGQKHGRLVNSPVWNSTCVEGGCYKCDGSDDVIIFGDVLDTYGANYTISYWVKYDSPSSNGEHYALDMVDNSAPYFRHSWSTDIGKFLRFQGWTDWVYGSAVNIWQFYVININASGLTYNVYHNGTWKVDKIFTLQTAYGNKNFTICASSYSTGTDSFFNGYVDEVGIWNGSLTYQDIQDLYNHPVYPFASNSSAGIQPSLTLSTTFVNNQTINYTRYVQSNLLNVTFTGASVNNSNIYNCDFYNSTAKFITNNSLNLANNNLNVIYIQSNYESWFNLTINCYNENASNNLSRMIYFDTYRPQINISSTFVNNSEYYDSVNLSYQVNFTDTNLFAFNHTITCGGTIKTSDYKENLSVTTYSLNVTNATSYLGINTCYINLTAWDSHTNNIPTPLNVVTGSNFFLIDNSIKISARDIKFTDNKNRIVSYFYLSNDRYKLKVTFNEKAMVHYFNISSTNRLYYRDDTGYKGHFIDFKIKRWIDFEGNNINQVVVNPIGNNEYEVIVYHDYETDEIEFESIGSLNVYSVLYIFSIIETPDLSEVLLQEISDNTFNINENLTDIKDVITMLGLIILWLGLWYLGYYAMQTGNELLSGTMIFLTLPIDIYFAYLFRETNMLGTAYIGIAMGFMFLWTIGVFILIKRKVPRFTQT